MAEWSKAPVLKTGDVKASVGSNPTLRQKTEYAEVPKWPKGSPAKGVGRQKRREGSNPSFRANGKTPEHTVSGVFYCSLLAFPFISPLEV